MDLSACATSEPNNRKSLLDIMDKRCHGEKSKYHTLFLNAGGNEHFEYEGDNTTLLTTLYEKSSKHWAYSCSGDDPFEGSIDYISNKTCGISMPDDIYDSARFCPQSLTYYGFCLKNGLYNVTLHFAEIVFAIDEDYSSLGKRVFDIYIQPVQRDFNIKEKAGGPNKIWIESFIANVEDNILEIRLLWGGKGSIFYLNGPIISAISVIPKFRIRRLSTSNKIGIVVGAVLASVLLLCLLYALMWRIGWIGDRESYVTYVKLRGKSYSLKQVKDATRNFSPNNKIGKGRFGIIYKVAQLPDQTVAMKKLSFQSNVDQIGTEVYALKQLKHENLVELLDVYSKRDLHLLFYECMERGSLRKALFDDSNPIVLLDWSKRVKICLGIAKGLKYLREDHTGEKVVHRNVRASNILLDGNFNPKVSDLGLAQLYDEENPYKFIQEIGTVADNIALMQACVLHSEQMLLNLVDTNLSGDYNKKQALKFLDLAMKCINLSPTLRPTMSEIVSVLEQISNLNTPSPSA
ncbi:hypothetical protein Patl1_09762 [Pistacia atlantica]|uniref:Uncharacterized protein n=1 Tax=Pistacia atlantica TaxID=434234 RepID=A0ACC1A5B0_9ROSI|nr:hypothetical protein Patl1_09762 [Pistacia atlantica]